MAADFVSLSDLEEGEQVELRAAIRNSAAQSKPGLSVNTRIESTSVGVPNDAGAFQKLQKAKLRLFTHAISLSAVESATQLDDLPTTREELA